MKIIHAAKGTELVRTTTEGTPRAVVVLSVYKTRDAQGATYLERGSGAIQVMTADTNPAVNPDAGNDWVQSHQTAD